MTRLIAWAGTERSLIEYEDGSTEIDYSKETRREIPFTYGTKPGWIRKVGIADGLSKNYVFGDKGASSFIVEMEDDDAAALLAGPSGENFQDVTNDPDFFERTYKPVEKLR